MKPYENGTWQILHLKQANMTLTKNGALEKWRTLQKNGYLRRAELSNF